MNDPDVDPSFFSVASRQRAHRQFTDAEVGDALIEQIVAAAVRAPSAENQQPWEFIVVRDRTTRSTISELMEQAWKTGGQQWSQARLEPRLLAEVERAMLGGFATAPVLIVACCDLARAHPATAAASMFPAIQNLLLAATALGLGSALTTIALRYDAELRELLALPDHLSMVAVIPLGWPARALGLSRREPATAHMHREHFPTPW